MGGEEVNTIPVWIDEHGAVGTLQSWADYYGIDLSTARYRWDHWGTFEKGEQFKEAKLFFYGLNPTTRMKNWQRHAPAPD
jgi:hypothetical protein